MTSMAPIVTPEEGAMSGAQLWPLFMAGQVLRSGGSQIRFVEGKTMLQNLLGAGPGAAG